MILWRHCLVVAVLLLLPTKTLAKADDEDEEQEQESGEENSGEDDEGDNDEPIEKEDQVASRRMPPTRATFKGSLVTRTFKKRPLECYVCSYKALIEMQACLDPSKFRVHTITCPSIEDKCFTSVVSKGNSYEAVVRGCRTGCVGNSDITCCDLNRCNNQAFAMPPVPSARVHTTSKSHTMQTNVVFFITILLVLQTVVKVTFV